VEETKILREFNLLHTRISDYIFVAKDSQDAKISQAIAMRMKLIHDACKDTGASFNASEQIQSLHAAQKELDLLLDDFLSLHETGVISESQHMSLVSAVRECDQTIRAMSDPEYS
jgi:hypothetical protein